MHKKFLPTLLAASIAAVSAAFSCSIVQAAPSSPSQEALTLQRIFTDPPLQGLLPRQAELSPAGHWASYLRPSEADSELLELWAQPLDGGAARRLVAVSDLIGKAAATLTEAEKMALERRRISGGGIVEYQWCGGDDKHLIVPLSGDLYLVNLSDNGVTTRRLTHETGEPAREPQCDKAGKSIAYVKQGDLWVQDLTSGEARQLTHSGSATRSTGLAEFIAEEELDRHQGFWWSPDGSRLLAMEVDDSGIPVKMRAQIFADRTAMTEQRYPAAGGPNAKVRALVIDVADGKVVPLDLPAESEYIARAGWFADGAPWLQWMPRDQKALHLVEFDPKTAVSREVLAERDPAWVEVHDDLRELPARPLSGKPALLWSSERSGRRQLYTLDRVTGALSALTAQPEPVAHVVCAAGERVVFAGATQGGRGRELFALNLKDSAAKAQMVTPGDARRWRDARGDDACEQLLITESAWGVPQHSSVLSLSGPHAGQPAIALTGTAADPLLAQIKPEAQPLDLLAADGKTRLNAMYLAPLTSKGGGLHPVVVFAYGGPGASTVGWHWDRDVPLFAYLQRQGFGVMTVDTRGMTDRDREFTRAHDHAFGKVEVADLFAAVHQLPQRVKGVDPKRIAFRGWSYGGYLAGRAILDVKTPFAAAIAIAPPTDWTLYDTAYTERYLGMPDGGKAPAYADASLLTRAHLLSKPLLIVHGTADDNVLFENTLRLIDALQNEGKLFELDIYPGKAHGIAGRKAQLHLAETEVDFLLRHLKPQ